MRDQTQDDWVGRSVRGHGGSENKPVAQRWPHKCPKLEPGAGPGDPLLVSRWTWSPPLEASKPQKRQPSNWPRGGCWRPPGEGAGTSVLRGLHVAHCPGDQQASCEQSPLAPAATSLNRRRRSRRGPDPNKGQDPRWRLMGRRRVSGRAGPLPSKASPPRGNLQAGHSTQVPLFHSEV